MAKRLLSVSTVTTHLQDCEVGLLRQRELLSVARVGVVPVVVQPFLEDLDGVLG